MSSFLRFRVSQPGHPSPQKRSHAFYRYKYVVDYLMLTNYVLIRNRWLLVNGDTEGSIDNLLLKIPYLLDHC